MNRVKKIYFLFSFVMIIACYALNKSYSMFVASEEKNVVDSVVPNLVSELSVSSITLSGNEEYLIKQTITNTSSVSINYALNANGSNYTIKMTSDEGNKVLGSLETNQSDIVYLYVKNDSTESNTITFELNKNYTTLNNDLTSNIDSTNLYTPVTGTTIPYQNEPNTLKYHILNNYVNSDLYTGTAPSQTNTTAVEAFSGKTENTIKLPLSTGTVEIPELTTFSNIETEEKGLYKAPDDYGDSYYFRGASTKNYVSFAGFTWRIVRINGDGSVRIVLDDVAKDSSGNVITTPFSVYSWDNAYLGYMYGTAVSTTYDATHKNTYDSTIKVAVDKWYEDNLKNNYANYLEDSLFCNDKTIASSSIGEYNSTLGYSNSTTYYASTERVRYSSGTTDITIAKPTFECAENATNDYSRFTVNETTLPNGNKTNGDLTYPIGLLTVDEVAYAGARTSTTNQSYYLYNSSITSTWWLLSPYGFDGSYPYNAYAWFVVHEVGSFARYNISFAYAFRPSINLKINILTNGGDGTSSNPYRVKLS